MARRIGIFSALAAAAAALVAVACSTTSRVPEGEYMLDKNNIVFENSRTYPKSDLSAYIKQSETPSFIGIYSPFADPIVFDRSTIGPSVSGMLRHLEYRGYYNSRIDTSVTIKGNKAAVNYNVTLGKQYPVKKIEYSFADPVIRDIFYADSLNHTLHEGQMLSEESLEAEATRFSSLLRSQGYYGVTKNYLFNFADTLSVPDSALLKVEMRNYTRNESPLMAKPLKKHTIRNVSYSMPPNMRVKQSFLDDINLIESGMTYSEELITTTYQRFSGNRIFNTVNISLTPIDTTGDIDCVIALTPAKMQNFEVNMDASTNSSGLIGLTPSLTYNHLNLFGGGEVLSLGFRGNFQFKLKDSAHSNEFAITTGIKFPRLLLLPFIKSRTTTLPATEISLAYNYQNRPEYTRNILSSSYGYSWSPSRNLRFAVHVPQLSIIKIYDVDQEFYANLNSSYLQYLYQNHFDLGSNASVYYTTNTNVNPKVSYFYFRGDVSSSGLALSSLNPLFEENRRGQHLIWGIQYAQYIRAQVSAVSTLRFGREGKMALATRLLAGAGYAYGNSLFSMPMEQMFYAGGANSMRGWQSRTIGPGLAQLDDTFYIYNQVGDMRLEANLELRFPLFWKLDGALFTDIGNIWNLPKRPGFSDDEYELSVFKAENLPKSIAMDWGLGARLDFGLLLIRVDLGVKAYDPARQKWLTAEERWSNDGFAVHLGIGYPF
ncbi:MAG: BamA/TamA family outer membrane protein [Bacteroidales bacterium]|nr:BamA/TamA family outer membrane protein [Bacteroidales bacterium]